MKEINLREPEYAQQSLKVVVQTNQMKYHEVHNGPIPQNPEELFDNLQDLCNNLDQQKLRILRILNIHEYREIQHAVRGNVKVGISEILWSHKENEMYEPIDYAIPQSEITPQNSNALLS